MEQKGDCDTVGEVYGKSKFADFSFNVNNIDKRKAVRVTNATESPYLVKKHTHIAEFSVVTPEQSKHIKPVDMAIPSMIPQGDPDLTAYLKNFSERITPSNNTTHSGSQHLKILESLRITPQYRQETSRN